MKVTNLVGGPPGGSVCMCEGTRSIHDEMINEILIVTFVFAAGHTNPPPVGKIVSRAARVALSSPHGVLPPALDSGFRSPHKQPTHHGPLDPPTCRASE